MQLLSDSALHFGRWFLIDLFSNGAGEQIERVGRNHKRGSLGSRYYLHPSKAVGRDGWSRFQKFAGALHGQHATKGIFITTSDFSIDANDYVSKIESKIVLIVGSKLAELMIEFGSPEFLKIFAA
jgi:hypothetical protein